MKKELFRFSGLLTTSLVSVYILGAGLGAGGCGGSSTGNAGGGDTGGTTITLSGQAAVRAGDVSGLRLSALTLKNSIVGFKPKFATIGGAPLASADVTLVKINADGTEETVSGVTATTADDGSYTLSDVPVTETGNGATTDFYYEVRIDNGSGYIAAPVAADADATVNVSPETNLAAMMLTDVAQTDATGATHVVPSESMINDLREAALDEVSGTLDGKVIIPYATDADQTAITATALASDGGDIEKAMEAVEAEKNYLALESSTDETEIASYLSSTTKAACDYNSNLILPQAAMETIAGLFASDTTVTMADLVAAFNTSNGSEQDVTSEAATTSLDTMLDNIDTALVGDAPIADADSVAAYVKRDLTSSTFDSTTPLEMDQALAFVQTLFQTDCNDSNFDFIKFANALGGSAVTASSEVIDARIYHNSMAPCSGGTPGHLQGTVRVYAAEGLTTTGVVLSGGDSPIILEASGPVVGNISTWQVTGDHCIALPSDVDYTVTATMTDTSTVTLNKTVPHRSVHEANISLVDAEGTVTQLANGSTNKVPVARPTFKWSPTPGTPTTEALDGGSVPDGTKIKFIFELAYSFTSDFLSAHSATSSPISTCGTGGSGNKLMDKNYFVSDTDCDIAACVAALHSAGTVHLSSGDISTSAITSTDVICRTNIQTFLVDDQDNIIGQAAGNFRNYCLDAGGDGNCDE